MGRQVFLLLACLIVFDPCSAQEVKKKRKRDGKFIEEYFVLRANKNLKHGEYRKYRLDVLDRPVPVEIGSFEQGKQSGEWYFLSNQGDLMAAGTFVDGVRDGRWTEFYIPQPAKGNLLESVFEPEGAIISSEGETFIDPSGLSKSAEGSYSAGSKTGEWNYFSRSGAIVHTYNHSSNHLLNSILPKDLNESCPFLGGRERFGELLFEPTERIITNRPEVSTYVKCKITIRHGTIEIDSSGSEGDESFINRMVDILSNFPNDWIMIYLDKPFRCRLDYIVDDRRSTTKLYFEKIP